MSVRARIVLVSSLVWAGCVVAAWIAINFVMRDPSESMHHFWPPWHPYWFNVLYATCSIPFVVLVGGSAVRRFGFRSRVGRAIALLSAGIVCWSIGNTIWFWYNTCGFWGSLGCAHGTATPYPSWADAGFLLLLPLWGWGLVELALVLAIGRADIVRMLWVPTIAAVVTCYVDLAPFHVLGVAIHAHSWLYASDYGTKQRIFSTLYMVSDIVILSMALMLLVTSRRAAGGMLFAGLVSVSASAIVLWAADLIFDQRDASGHYYNGDISDGLYWCSLALMIGAFWLFDHGWRKLAGPMLAAAAAAAPAPEQEAVG